MTNFVRQHLWRGFLAVGLVLALPWTAFAEEVTLLVTKIDGTQLNGQIVAWSASELTLQTKNDSVTIASPQLLQAQWRHEGSSDPTEKRTFVELVDGTLLPHSAFETQQGQATITTPLAAQPLTISTDRIAFVQLSPDAPELKQLDADHDGDVLVIRKKMKGTFDHLTGIIREVSSQQVEFSWEGEVIPVKRSKVTALAYFHARTPVATEPVCWLNLRGGGRLPVIEILLQDQEVQVRTLAGLAFSLPLKSLQDADYSQGKLAYLSDLQPIEQRWTPLVGLPKSAELIRLHGLPRRDQSYTGSAISLRWPSAKRANVDGELKTYAKGLALRSRTEIRYRLPKGMRRFVTLAGIDPVTANQGNVTLEIFADRRSVWQGAIEGGSAPTAIDVVLDDARELRIVVDYGENLDFGDRLHLAEAQLSQ